MTPLGWIVLSGLLMSAIALVGSVTLVLSSETLGEIPLPLVAFCSGLALMWLTNAALGH